MDNTIPGINRYPVQSAVCFSALIHWISIYLVDVVIHLLNNWGLTLESVVSLHIVFLTEKVWNCFGFFTWILRQPVTFTSKSGLYSTFFKYRVWYE